MILVTHDHITVEGQNANLLNELANVVDAIAEGARDVGCPEREVVSMILGAVIAGLTQDIQEGGDE